LKTTDFELLAGCGRKSRFSIKALIEKCLFSTPGALGLEIPIFC